jgi:hypothetical protein
MNWALGGVWCDWGCLFFDFHMNTSADQGVKDDRRNPAINGKINAVALAL